MHHSWLLGSAQALHANAALSSITVPQGALGNLVRNSGMLCADIMQAGALQVGCKTA